MTTIRQTKAAHKLSEIIRKSGNKKNISLAKILKEAGYSDSVTRKPKLVTERKGWKELTKDLLPDDILFERLNNLITMPLNVTLIKKGNEVIVKEELNSSTVARGLDIAFKLKGYYNSTSPQDSLLELLKQAQDMPDDELSR